MKPAKLFMYGLFAVVLALSLTGCDNGSTTSGSGGNTPAAITYTAQETGGVDGTTDSAGIVFTFSASVGSLNAADITVGGAASKGSATLSGSGKTWTLSTITVNNAGLATVSINKRGIEAGTKNVIVHKQGQATPTEFCSIKWNLNGGTPGAGAQYPTQIAKGAVLVQPSPNPTKANNTFGGWYNNSGLTTAYNFADPVTADLSLYAKWNAGQINPGDITYTAEQTGGEDGVTDSDGIVFTFSATVSSLTAADITVSGAASKGSATITGSGTSWTLSPITVGSAGVANVSINKSGIQTAAKYVVVYKAGQALLPGTEGLEYVLINNDTAYRVNKGSVTEGAVIIPAVHNGLPVTEIGSIRDYSSSPIGTFIGTFSNTNITSITIPEGVTSIGNYAFQNCSSLTTITIPASVTSIGNYAFQNCSSLTSITIPEGVTEISSGAFQNCTSLASITIPASVTSISNSYIFRGCTSLTDITVDVNNPYYTIQDGILYNKGKTALIQAPAGRISGSVTILSSVMYINWCAFDSCSGLTSITIPEGVTEISHETFRDCTGLTSITIPASVTKIDSQAFYGCSSLTSITIPEGVTSIQRSAFQDCTSLTSVTIPNSVTSIGDLAFENCTSLTSITIPNSVTSIGRWAFENCTGLTSITIPNSLTSIANYTFLNCTSLTSITIPNSVTSIGDLAFKNCTSLTSITISASVTSIGSDVFSGCTSLASITIPASVTNIGVDVFEGWTSTQTIYVPWTSDNIPSGWYGWNRYCNAQIVYQGQ